MSTKVRLYFSEKIQSDLISHLTEHQSHYVKDVMRLKVGDGFSIFNEQGEWNAVIENYKKGEVFVKILNTSFRPEFILKNNINIKEAIYHIQEIVISGFFNKKLHKKIT